MSLVKEIKQEALELGFDLVGITGACPIEPSCAQHFKDWLKAGFAGQMDYMHNNLEKRTNPALLLEGAKSVIVVGLNYKPPETKTEPKEPTGKIANFARYEDYHGFIKKQLRKLAEFITSLTGENLKFKICVDSAPLAERALAMRAGLGFIGKNHMLINPQLGPQILLGEIITNLELEADKPIDQTCSDCNKCMAACPTGALRADGQFDATRCISYLTTEHKSEITSELALKIGDWLFGCDECVLVCPWYEKGPMCKNKNFKFLSQMSRLNLQKILNMKQKEFDAEFTGLCITRTGLERLKRNAKICLSNANSR
jgi:epoxyqueuosine reductase